MSRPFSDYNLDHLTKVNDGAIFKEVLRSISYALFLNRLDRGLTLLFLFVCLFSSIHLRSSRLFSTFCALFVRVL